MAEAARPIDPLIFTERLVNDDGTPTDYFLRQWQSVIGLLQSSNGSIADIVALQNINLTAGVGLVGGGNLTADRTFDLEDTPITPAIYGDANNVAQIEVDQQGRIIDISDVPIAGGGGGGATFTWPIWLDDVASVSSHASKGMLFVPFLNVTVTGIAGYFVDRDTTVDYVAGIYRLDGGGQIDELTAVSTAQAGPSNTQGSMFFEVSATMTAGSRYVVLISASNQADNFALPISQTTDGSDAEFVWYPSFPHELYSEGAANAYANVTLTQATPAIGGTPFLFTTGTCFGIGLRFSI